MLDPRKNPIDSDPIEHLRGFNSELVIGLVGAVGCDINRIIEILQNEITRTSYNSKVIKISRDVIPQFGTVEFNKNDPADRINKMMTAGNRAREKSNDNSVLALGASAWISNSRVKVGEPNLNSVYIIDSLKRPEEVKRLRDIYPAGFVLIGVHADEERRSDSLKQLDISSEDASKLIKRDGDEKYVEHGQRLKNTFFLSDFFIRIDGNNDRLKSEVRRIIELLFANPFQTPSFDEHAMYLAFASALRSADLSRQVGAVIAKNDQILATGANDSPKAGGGLYWPIRDKYGRLVDVPDGRDYKRGYDSNKSEQRQMVETIIEQLTNYVQANSKEGLSAEEYRSILLSKTSPISDLTEFGRVVHAEMDAITSCSRSGIPITGATLYSTTFPCHNCAKHIVASGITRVVYIEPYEKSKAKDFHQDSIVFGSHENADDERVLFEPFMGIGPRKYFDLFSMNLSTGDDIVRKNKRTGANEEWDPHTASPRVKMLPSTYLELELEAANLFEKKLISKEQEGTSDEEIE
ncbi:anti-phage dCTP deaminase [Gimesia maris]|uniref:anti-phage dCTP deaminase n=1 Tax=Gimesia maris TaxID=122 RepID=UPI0032EAA79E